MDVLASCEFLKAVGFSCHYFFRNKLLQHRDPVSSSESPWGTNYRSLGKDGCRIGSLPCLAFRPSWSRNPPGTGAAQPLARRWSWNITSQEVGDTCLSCHSIPCPGALAWVEHEWQEHFAVFQPVLISAAFSTTRLVFPMPLCKTVTWSRVAMTFLQLYCTGDAQFFTLSFSASAISN